MYQILSIHLAQSEGWDNYLCGTKIFIKYIIKNNWGDTFRERETRETWFLMHFHIEELIKILFFFFFLGQQENSTFCLCYLRVEEFGHS